MTEDEGEGESGHSVVLWIVIGLGVFVVGVFVLIILAAVLGSFVLGMGEAPSEPQRTVALSFNDSERQITHQGGEPINASRLVVGVNDDPIGTWAEITGDDGRVVAGDRLTLSDLENGDEIFVVWQGEGQSRTLGTFEYDA